MTLNDKQTRALSQLAVLTDLGRNGGNPGSQCLYNDSDEENCLLLFQMNVTDGDMKHFSHLPDWNHINLRETSISEKGLKHLSGQTSLKTLDVSQTQITTLNAIKKLTELTCLKCDGLRNLTDKGSVALKNLCKLQFLDLNATSIGDKTLKLIANMSGMEKLTLAFTEVSNEGLRHLGKLTKLQELSLFHTPVSNEGLAHLYELKNLKRLIVGSTQISLKGKNAIKKAIPKLKLEESGIIY